MQRDDGHLLDIVLAAQSATSFAAGMTREQFLEDKKTQSAILHQKMIIGEASRRTSTEFRVTHDHLPWPKMIGMRNIIVHEYDYVDLEQVWDVVRVHLPELIKLIQPLLPREND